MCIRDRYTVHEIGTSLDHSLIDQFLEGFFLASDTDVIQEHIPETGIDQVTGSVFGASQVCLLYTSGFFEYVVPPLEGFWWQPGVTGIDYSNKEKFCWLSLIRLPDFVSREDFTWAVREATIKKKIDFSKVEFLEYNEGTCVQCMHCLLSTSRCV